MKTKTADLTGPALDWAVIYAQCLEATEGKPILARDLADIALRNGATSATTDWSKGGPIIEREKLCVGYRHQLDPAYVPLLDPATVCWARTTAGGYLNCGPTPLIAAMRCYVASRLGDEVDVPDELVCTS